MKSLFKFLKDFIENKGLLVFLSTLFNKFSFFIISVVAARMLIPEIYGEILLIIAVFGLLVTLSGLGSYQGLLRFGVLEKLETNKNILSAYIFWRGLLNHLIVTLFFFLISSLYLIKYEDILYIIFFFAIRLLGFYFFNHIQIDFRIRGDNRMFALTNIWVNFINLILVTAFTFLWHERGFLIAMAISPWFVFLIKNPNKYITKKRPDINLKQFWNYSYNSVTTSFLSDVLFALDTFMLAIFIDESSVAFYKVAVILPMNLNFLPLTFIHTDYPKLVKNYENKTYLIFYIKNYYKLFFPLGLILISLGFIFKDNIIEFVFGPQYAEGSGNIFFIMLLAFVGNMWMRNLYVSLINAVGKAKWNTYIVISTLFIVMILMLILIPEFGINGAAVSMATGFTFSGICSMVLFYKYLKSLD